MACEKEAVFVLAMCTVATFHGDQIYMLCLHFLFNRCRNNGEILWRFFRDLACMMCVFLASSLHIAKEVLDGILKLGVAENVVHEALE